MTNEELVQQIKRGRSDLMETLWDQTRAFVYKKARTAMSGIPASCGVTIDDLAQSGYIALAAAVDTYDAQRGSFLTWLAYYLKVEFSVAAGYRSTKRDPLNMAVSLDAPLTGDAEEDGTLLDVIPGAEEDGHTAYNEVEDRIYQEQLRAALESAIGVLPTMQAAAIRGRYWEGKASSLLAEEHGVSETHIRSAERAGLQRLRSPVHAAELAKFLESNTDYYKGGSLYSFNSTGASSVENIVFRREELTRRWDADHRRRGRSAPKQHSS